MSPQDIRETLIERTIMVIADDGLDKATTKAIVTGTNINEAYIYRHFLGKEDLLAKTFDKLDEELNSKATQYLDVMYMEHLDFELRCRIYFTKIWGFLLGNKRKCLTFVRYYYSSYFQRYSAKIHKQRYKPLVEEFKKVFKDEADVWMILNHILNVMFSFSVLVHNGEMPEEDDYSEHVFRVIYASIKQYFKKTQESSF